MRREEIKLKYGNDFADDYLYDFSKVSEFFTYNPYDPESFRQRYTNLKSYPSTTRDVLVKVLREYNLELGAGAETLHNIEVLAQPDAAVVVTGQQAGILGGPLYTVHKALTAIQLAGKLSVELDKPVIPVFWIAAEDHDFGEINHVHILDRDGQPVRLRLSCEPQGKYSIGSIPVPEEAAQLLAELNSLTPDTEFKSDLLQFLQSSCRHSANLADWFGRILMKWLGALGLVFVNPMDERLRELAKGLFAKAVERFPQINKSLAENAAVLRTKGYPVAIEKDPDNVNLFMYQDNERLPLFAGAKGFSLRGKELPMTKEELLALIDSTPSRFSPNVVLRPLTQDVLFPTLAYVGGPGEIGYYSQYRQVYQLLDLEMPVIYPRANITLVEGGAEKCLNKYQLNLEDVLYRADTVRDQYLKSRDVVGIEQVFTDLEQAVSAAYPRAIEAITAVDPALAKLGQENRDRVISQIDWLKNKTLQAHRKANDIFLRQFGKACQSLRPNGQLQERFMGCVYFALKYGQDFFVELNRIPLTENSLHKIIYLKG